MQQSKTRPGLSVELVRAKGQMQRAAKKIVKWKCKGVNPEQSKQVPRWWADPCEFLMISKRGIYLEVRLTRPAKLAPRNLEGSR